MSTALFMVAAIILGSTLRWYLASRARWVQAGLWGAAVAGLAIPLYLGIGGQPAVQELVWPFAAGLGLGEILGSWVLRKLAAGRRETQPRRPGGHQGGDRAGE